MGLKSPFRAFELEPSRTKTRYLRLTRRYFRLPPFSLGDRPILRLDELLSLALHYRIHYVPWKESAFMASQAK